MTTPGAPALPPQASGAEHLDPRAHLGALGARMGVEILEASADRVVGRMPVEGNTQPYGILHGGATCVLAESVGSAGAALWAGAGNIAVGVDINATHHRAVHSGWVTAVATPAHRGRTATTYEIVVSDDRGKRVCTARLTCAIRPAPGPSPATAPPDQPPATAPPDQPPATAPPA